VCRTIYLLADRRLPDSTDAPEYPGLTLYPVEEYGPTSVRASIRRVAPAAFVYDVRPDGYCGCYFYHETPGKFAAGMAERDAHPTAGHGVTREQAEAMWRDRTSAVKSFARYLAAHADAALAVYVVWEGCAGRKEPTRAVVPPSYFDAPGFESLPEDLLLTIIPESVGGEEWPWDAATPRTHEWLGGARSCSAPDPDATGAGPGAPCSPGPAPLA
jgi:hypothetical protein